MNEIEILTTHIGELVAVEINDVQAVEYVKDNGELVAFIIVMQNGKRYLLAVSEAA
ncbi:MAG: hypothetical protein FWC82_04395 [Firmicutes bacterium]|nr:hypothetical protein [Bacillota bacterium]